MHRNSPSPSTQFGSVLLLGLVNVRGTLEPSPTNRSRERRFPKLIFGFKDSLKLRAVSDIQFATPPLFRPLGSVSTTECSGSISRGCTGTGRTELEGRMVPGVGFQNSV